MPRRKSIMSISGCSSTESAFSLTLNWRNLLNSATIKCSGAGLTLNSCDMQSRKLIKLMVVADELIFFSASLCAKDLIESTLPVIVSKVWGITLVLEVLNLCLSGHTSVCCHLLSLLIGFCGNGSIGLHDSEARLNIGALAPNGGVVGCGWLVHITRNCAFRLSK